MRAIGAGRQRHALQMQARGDDQATQNKLARFRETQTQRAVDLVLREIRHALGARPSDGTAGPTPQQPVG